MSLSILYVLLTINKKDKFMENLLKISLYLLLIRYTTSMFSMICLDL